MTGARKTISIVIPFYNEQENLPRIIEELSAVRANELKDYGMEVLLMDNHSTDKSNEVARGLKISDATMRVIRLSRNFGYQANIVTGLLKSTGDAVVQLDADGEDDPKLIAEFVKIWEKGFRVVYGVRKSRREGWILRFQRALFYRVLRYLSAVDIPVDAGDFRLMDRRVIEVIGQFRESNPYIRGLVSYAGFEHVGYPYDRRPRYAGESKFSWWNYLELAWDGITSFSRKPLSMATWLGFSLAITSFLAGGFYLALFVVEGRGAPGFTTLVLIQLLLCGIQLLCMGILGTYIARIYDDVKARPRSVIESEHSGG